jgi:hypothetical protein
MKISDLLTVFRTAIYMLWDWGWTWKNLTVTNTEVAIDATAQTDTPDANTGKLQGTGVS